MSNQNQTVMFHKTVNDGDDFLNLYDLMMDILKNKPEYTILKEFIKLLKDYDIIYSEYKDNFFLKLN